MKLLLILFLMLGRIVSTAQSTEKIQKNFIDSLLSENLAGKTMPLFTLQDQKGKLHSNNKLIDKITIINFWFEACAPCIAEMNALETLYKDFKQNKSFQFLSITYENKKAIKRIGKKHQMSYPIFSTSRDSCYQLNFNKGFPTTIILNKNGEIVFITSGGPTDPVIAEDTFKKDIYPVITRVTQ